MRIIAGKLGGRKLSAPRGLKVRPTGDRLKASMFSALADCCREALVLDLFSGSGALGLEALSRGAAQVTFVEKDAASLRALQDNIDSLGVGQSCRVVRAEVGTWLSGPGKGEEFDLIFADPPFASGLAAGVLEWWCEKGRAGSVLVLEYPAGNDPASDRNGLQPVKTTVMGGSAYSIYTCGS